LLGGLEKLNWKLEMLKVRITLLLSPGVAVGAFIGTTAGASGGCESFD